MIPPGVCRKFYKNGICKFGTQCKYNHIKGSNTKNVNQEKNKKNLSHNNNTKPTNNQAHNQSKESNLTPNDEIKKIKYQKNDKRKGQISGNRKNRKNTESFKPNYHPTDMRILTTVNTNSFDLSLGNRDVIIIPNLFQSQPNIYQNLLNELQQFNQSNKRSVWKKWHGDSHLIADDGLNWKNDCPIFTSIIDKIKNYFQMDIKATRFNWYQDQTEWKPYHHDAAAIKPEKAKTQNFTVGVSFGATREVSFQHAKNRATVSIPLVDGTLYAFSKDVNVEWRHGILATKHQEDRGRISVIAWGWVDNMEDLQTT